MPGHEHHAFVDHLVGDRDRLLGIAGVVADLRTSCSPSTPPAALMSATACSAPAFIC
jgi:hypothetical protein